jgi:hypothetical protein
LTGPKVVATGESDQYFVSDRSKAIQQALYSTTIIAKRRREKEREVRNKCGQHSILKLEFNKNNLLEVAMRFFSRQSATQSRKLEIRYGATERGNEREWMLRKQVTSTRKTPVETRPPC